MPAHPKAGASYRQEYLRGEAEGTADVLSLTEHATVPFGSTQSWAKATGTGPTFVEMTLVTEEAMYPSGALRSVKLKPPSAI